MAPDVRPCHYKNNDTTDADRHRASAALFGTDCLTIPTKIPIFAKYLAAHVRHVRCYTYDISE